MLPGPAARRDTGSTTFGIPFADRGAEEIGRCVGAEIEKPLPGIGGTHKDPARDRDGIHALQAFPWNPDEGAASSEKGKHLAELAVLNVGGPSAVQRGLMAVPRAIGCVAIQKVAGHESRLANAIQKLVAPVALRRRGPRAGQNTTKACEQEDGAEEEVLVSHDFHAGHRV